MAKPHILENALYRVEVEPNAGRIVSIVEKVGRYDLIAEPRLAESFRILLPIPDGQCNYIIARDQTLSACEAMDDALALSWRGPLTGTFGQFDLDVELRIALVGEAIEFNCEVRNGTEHEITEVWYPVLSGLKGLGDEADWRDTMAYVPSANEMWVQNIFADFGMMRTQLLGVEGYEHSQQYPGTMPMPWLNFHQPALDRSIYLAALERTPRVKGLRLAMDPGLSERRAAGNWPLAKDTDLPFGMTVNWTHFPHTPPGETFRGAPIVLQAHEGNWRESAAIYRKWFTERFGLADTKSWIRQHTAALHTMFLLPEDNLHLTYKDMPRWGADAKRFGIKALCLWGWDLGGHDRAYPHYEPDPRLGTWEELEAGVRACQDMGLRVYMFANCQPIDMTTDWYEQELHKYRIMDPYGEQFFITNYWGMGTFSARTRFFTGRPFSEMNPAHPEVRELLVRQMRRLAEIGVDGVHIDKMFQTPMDYNPRLTWTKPDRAHHEGIIQYLEEMLAECRAINPEFSISFEGLWDRLMSYSDVYWWGPMDSGTKSVFPQRALTTGISQPFDYGLVNTASLNGDVLMVAPGNLTAGAEHEATQPLLEYIREIIRIREPIWDIVSLGAIVDASHGIFKARTPAIALTGAFTESDDNRWTLFRDEDTGRHGLVLVNFTQETMDATVPALPGSAAGACRVCQPYQEDVDARFPVTITVPSEHAVFVVTS